MKFQASKIAFLTIALGAVFTFFAFQKEKNTTQNTDNRGVAILQLFTSESCSSCPPADDILRDYANKDNVFALSYHVTYWNRLGWTDPFSQKKFDDKQYAYGEKFRLSSVYTPQVVVNGGKETVGSKENQVANLVKTALSTPVKTTISLEKSLKNNDISINYTLSGKIPQDAILTFALVERNLATAVKRGENEGRTLHHDNVVRLEQSQKATEKGSVSFEIAPTWKKENCAVIAFVQEANLGQVTGAAKIGF